MNLRPLQPLLNALIEPRSLLNLQPKQWDLLIRQARRSDLLARIAARADEVGVLAQCPAGPHVHLASALKLANRQLREVRREVAYIREALAPTGVSFVLLKGAAYALRGLRMCKGRMMSDIDILVPHAQLSSVESALMKRGWSSSSTNAYDQRYYRQWMHELPPMTHIHRGTSLDVHHAILPITARARPSSAALLAAALDVEGESHIKLLSPVDMVLHSATHLFYEGELEHGLRGLVDLDGLMREFATYPGFWEKLVPRAIDLQLTRPLCYALRFTRAILDSPIPDDVTASAARTQGALATRFQTGLMDALYLRALQPAHPSTSDSWTPIARAALYVRGHWLKMPPLLLAIHLGRKLFTSKPKAQEDAP